MRIVMKPALLVLLLAATASAQPEKTSCKPTGAPIFEIDRRDTANPKFVQAAKLYASGAWTFEETDAAGKSAGTGSGCLSADAIKAIQAELTAAKWKVTTAKIKCMAMSPHYTAYKAGGKDVFESHVCGGKTLDEASQKALDDLEKQLAVAFPK
jgi:hypothetical protein